MPPTELPIEDYAIVTRNWQRFQYGKDRGHFRYVNEARHCEDMYLGAGLQWSQEDLEYLTQIGRPAQEQNHIFPAINTAIGLQLQSRVDIAFRPAKEGSSENTANLLSKLIMQIGEDIHYRWHETQAFSDGIIMRRGYLEFKMDWDENLMGNVTCSDINPLHVIPDPDSSSYDPDTWADVIILRWMTIDQIAQTYGQDKADEISAYYGDTYKIDPDLDIQETEGFGDDETGLAGQDSDAETSVRRVLVIDRQHKRLEMQKSLVFATGDVKSCVTMTPEQIEASLAAGAYMTKRNLTRIRWTVTTADILLHDDWSPYKTYTIVPYFPYFRRGRTRGMVDNAISPQIACNKIVSQVIHILNSTANSGWIVEEGSLTNMTVAQLADFGSQTGVVVEYRKGSQPPVKIQANTLPTGHEHLIDRAEMSIKTIMGISDALQGLNGAEVSGVAITTKQYMGQTQLGGPMDNLARTRHLGAAKLLELIQTFYSEQRVVMITDSTDISKIEHNPVTLNEVLPDGTVVNDLTLGEYSVVISDMPTQATFMDNQFRQALDMRKEGIAIPDTSVIEMSTLTKKHDIAKVMKEQIAQADPVEEAKARDLNASADLKAASVLKAKNEAANVGVDAMFSATQAAGILVTNPMIGPMADQIARSAGLEDQDAAPIIPSMPMTSATQMPGADLALAGLPGQGAQPSQPPGPAGAALPVSTTLDPLPSGQPTPAPMGLAGPDISGPDGMGQGIETVRND